MRRILIGLFCLMLLSVGARAADAEITALNAGVKVRADGSCEVTVTADVTFSMAKNEFLFPLGADADDISLTGWSYEETEVDGINCLRISNSADFSGPQRFTCTYTLPCGVTNAGNGQYFRLHLPETGFEYAIQSYTLQVTFPVQVTALPEWTSGYYDDVIDNYLSIQVAENTVAAQSTQEMKDHETLTMEVLFPPESFALQNQPGRTATIDQILFFALFVFALLYWFFRLRYGLVLPKPQQTASTEATAGEVACQLCGERPDAAGILAQWGALGYLTIHKTRRGHIVVRKQMEMGNERKPVERRFFQSIFRSTASCDTQSPRFQAAVKAMQRPTLANWQRRMFAPDSGNPLFLRRIGALGGLFACLMVFDRLLPATGVRWVFLPLLTALGAALCILLQLGVGAIFRRRRRLRMALGALSLIALLTLGALTDSSAILFLNVLLQIFCALTTIFGGRRSEAGLEQLRRLLGLRRFLRSADTATLKHLSSLDPQYFYRMLPFAEAFGVDKAFATRFSGRAAEPCTWLLGPARTPLRPAEFCRLYAEFCAAVRGEKSPPSPVLRSAPSDRQPEAVAVPASRPQRPHRRVEYDFEE